MNAKELAAETRITTHQQEQTMHYTKATSPELAKSIAPTPGSEIPTQLSILNAVIDFAEKELELLTDRMDSVLQPILPTNPSKQIDNCANVDTPLGASIQSASSKIELIANRLMDIRSRIGL